MADEIIGSVGIAVEVDLSSLQAGFDAAIAEARNDGQSLTEAFNSAVSSIDLSGFKGSLEDLQQYISQTAQAINAAMGSQIEAPDLSQFIGQLNETTGAAQQLGEQLSLFQQSGTIDFSDATGQLNLFSDAIEVVGQDSVSAAPQVQQLGESAQQAGSDIGSMGAQVETAGEQVAGASASFGSLVENLAGLVVLRQIESDLMSMGSAIAESSDNITRADIALTHITGDATQAQETIAGLRDIAMSDGLAMPGLLTAATRMQQILGPGADVTSLLKSIADGAAVMGTSIEQAANSFDRIINAGTLQARTLTTLGLSLQSVADAMNELNPALNATAQTASAAFKALDPGDRIDVLQQALKSLEGTAQEVAQNTFGGLWNSLIAQWDQLLESAGQALLPLAQALKQFVSSDIIPFLQSLVDGFRALPQPMQDAALALGAIAAAAVPVGVAVAGIATAIGALEGVATVLAGLQFGVEAIATATATGVSGFELLGAAAAVAAPEIAAIALGLAAFAALDFSGVIQGFENLGQAIGNVVESIGTDLGAPFEAMKQAMEDAIGVASGWDVLRDAIAGLAQEFPQLQSAINDVSAALKESETSFSAWDLVLPPGVAHLKEVADALNFAATALNIFAATQQTAGDASTNLASRILSVLDAMQRIKDMSNAAADGMSSFTDATQNLLTHQADLKSKIDDARTAVEEISQSLKDGTTNASGYRATTDDLAAAQVALQKATDSYNASLGITIDKHTQLVALAQATKEFLGDVNNALNLLGGNARDAAAAFDADSAKLELLGVSAGHAQENLNNAVQALADLQAKGVTNLGDIEQALKRVSDAADKLAASNKKWIDDFTGFLDKLATAGNINFGQLIAQQLSDINGVATTTTSYLQDLGVLAGTTLPAQMSALNQALVDSGAKLTDLGSRMANIHPSANQLETDLTQLLGLAGQTGNWDYFDQRLENLDKQVAQIAKVDLPLATSVLGNFATQLINTAGTPLTVITTSMGQWEANIQKLAKTDLPDAITQQQNFLSDMQKLADQGKASYGQVIAAAEELDKLQIQLGNDTGASADMYVYNLEKMKLEQQSLALSSHGMADEMVKAMNDVLKGFDQLGQAMADAIVQGHNLGAALVKEFQKIAASILGDLINAALVPLKKELIELLSSLLPSLGDAMKVTGGGISGLADAARNATSQMTAAAKGISDAASSLSDSLKNMDGSVIQVSQTFNTFQSSLTSWMSAIGAVIGAIAGIVGDVYLAAIDTKLFHVETSLVQIRNEVQNLRADEWSRHGDNLAKYDWMITLLQSIDASDKQIAAAGLASGTASNPAVQQDLDNTASATAQIAANTGYINNSIQAMNRTVVGEIQNVEMILYAPIAADLQAINSNIVGHAAAASSNSQQNANMLAHSIGLGAQSVVNSIGTIPPIIAAGVSAEEQALINDAQAQGKAAAAATTQSDQLAALAKEQADYAQLIADATKDGNASLLAQAQAAAAAVQQQITTLQNGQATQTNTIVGAANSNNETFSAVGSGIIVAVGAGADKIVAAVGGTANSAQYNPGTVGAVAPPTSGQGVGSPSSGTYTPEPLTAGSGSAGYSSQPKTSSNAPPTNTGQKGTGTPDNSPGSYHGTPGGALSGATGPSTIGGASGSTGIPSFDEGGPVTSDTLANVHAGEYVLNPDQVNGLIDALNAPPTFDSPSTTDLLNQQISISQQQIGKDSAYQEKSTQLQEQIVSGISQLAQDYSAGPRALGAPEVSSLGPQAAFGGPLTTIPQAAYGPTSSIPEAAFGPTSSIPQAAFGGPQTSIPAAAFGGPRTTIPAAAFGPVSYQPGFVNEQQQGGPKAAFGPVSYQPGFYNEQETNPLYAPQGGFMGLGGMANVGAAALAPGGALNPIVGTPVSDGYTSSGPRPLGAPTLPSYDDGGVVPFDQVAQVHKGEEVLAPDVRSMLMKLLTTPSYAQSFATPDTRGMFGAGITIHAPVTISGAQNGEQIARQFVAHLKRVVPQGGLTS